MLWSTDQSRDSEVRGQGLNPTRSGFASKNKTSFSFPLLCVYVRGKEGKLGSMRIVRYYFFASFHLVYFLLFALPAEMDLTNILQPYVLPMPFSGTFLGGA